VIDWTKTSFYFICSDFIKKYEQILKRNTIKVCGRPHPTANFLPRLLAGLSSKQARLSGDFKFFFSACERRVNFFQVKGA